MCVRLVSSTYASPAGHIQSADGRRSTTPTPRFPLPGWRDYLLKDQRHLASRSTADKEVYVGVEIPARKGLYRALGGLAGSISDREVASLADRSRGTLDPYVRENVTAGSTVYTDALNSYSHLGDAYAHETIDHAEKYVDGHIHTDGIENFWSLLKRGLIGTYISVEPYHLFRYLDERMSASTTASSLT